MGIHQSREDIEPTLKMLRSISAPVLQEARAKLNDLVKTKSKMHITKWELLLILQMNARDIKTISQFIQGQNDPQFIDINSLFCFLILTNQHIALDSKIDEIINFVTFDIQYDITRSPGTASGTVHVDELRYVFQLSYQLLNRITDLDLNFKAYYKQVNGTKQDQDENEMGGSQAEMDIVDYLYNGVSKKTQADRREVVTQLRKNEDVQRFLAIFHQGKVASEMKTSLLDKLMNNVRVDLSQPVEMELRNSQDAAVAEVNAAAGAGGPTEPSLQPEGSKRSMLSSSNQQASQGKPDPDQIRKLNNQSQASASKAKAPPNLPGFPSDKKEEDSEVKIDRQNHRVVTASLEKTQKQGEKDEMGNTTQATARSIEEQKAELIQTQSQIKISKRITELKNENIELIQIYNQQDNLQKMSNNIQHIIEKQLDFYAQRQLIQCMNTMFAKKKAELILPDCGIEKLADVLRSTLANSLVAEQNSIYVKGLSAEDEAKILTTNIKNSLRNNLEEFLQQNQAFLKYQQATASAKMMHFHTGEYQRGRKRIMEQKKFKLLGQLQTLRAMHTTLEETNFDVDSIKGDKFYQLIYTQMHGLYRCKINQEFLINMIRLKNKKRESKRFITFLEGALQILDLIIGLETTNVPENRHQIPPIYLEAKSMVMDKLNHLKHVDFIETTRQYNFKKIHVMNYFSNLGKLKAFYKIQQVNKKNKEQIQSMFVSTIHKLQNKLQKIDKDIIDFHVVQQTKTNVYQSYFSALGKQSVIKCGIKGLKFNHIFDYYALAAIKQRSHESIWLLMEAKNAKELNEFERKNDQEPEEPAKTSRTFVMPTRLNAEHLGSILKIQKMKQIDKIFNVGTQADSDGSDINYDKYSDHLHRQIDLTNKMAAKYQHFEEYDISEQKRHTEAQDVKHQQQSIKENLQRLYYGLSLENEYQSLQNFYDHSNAPPISLDFTKDDKNQQFIHDLETLANCFQEFVPLVEKEDKSKGDQDHEDKKFNEFLSDYSTSFKYINSDESRRYLYQEREKADKLCLEYLEMLMNFGEDDFLEIFQKHRDGIFVQSLNVIFMINKKGYLNFFDQRFLSLPIEHSLQHNYQAYQVIKMHLKESFKQRISDGFNQVLQQNELEVDIEGVTNYDQDVTIHKDPTGHCSELFKILSNSQKMEVNGKLSLLKPLINELESQDHVHKTKTSIYQNILKSFKANSDLEAVKKQLERQASVAIDEQSLQQLFHEHEILFIQQNKINNFCYQMDDLYEGTKKYLKVFKKTIMDLKGGEVSFVDKVVQDISGVQASFKIAARQLRQQFVQQQLQRQSTAKRGAKSGAQSPQNKKVDLRSKKKQLHHGQTTALEDNERTEKSQDDIIQNELKILNEKIITKLVSMMVYQDLTELARKSANFQSFVIQINKESTLNNLKLIRIQKMLQHISQVFDSVEHRERDPSVTKVNFTRGAKIMDSVLTGNVIGQINIFTPAPKLDDARDGAICHERIRSTASFDFSLNQTQKCLNYLSNFLQQLCQQEDILSSHKILKQSPLFNFIQKLFVEDQRKKLFLKQKVNLQHAMDHCLNVHQIQNTPVDHILLAFQHHTKFIKQEVAPLIQESDENLITSKFFEIISLRGGSMAESQLNKINDIFSKADLIDEEKTDFSNAQTSLRHLLDHNLRVFREWLDGEANKKLTQVYESTRAEVEMKMTESATTLHILTQCYYLKQIQQSEEFTKKEEIRSEEKEQKQTHQTKHSEA